MLRAIFCLLVLGLVMAACGDGEGASETQPQEKTASSVVAATSTTESGETATTTLTVPPSTTTTPEQSAPESASIMAPGRGVPAPLSGWIVSETPYVMWILFWGQPAPDSVAVNGETMIDKDPVWHQYWSSPIELAPGVNQLHLAVEYQGEIIQEADIPVTFLEGAEELLGWITAATEDSITVDLTEWNDDQEFPGPEDPDPGVLTTLPVADQVRVIVSDEVDVDYEWLQAEVNAGHTNVQGFPGLEDWNPTGVYPYTLTIHNGQVVQIWKVPLG